MFKGNPDYQAEAEVKSQEAPVEYALSPDEKLSGLLQSFRRLESRQVARVMADEGDDTRVVRAAARRRDERRHAPGPARKREADAGDRGAAQGRGKTTSWCSRWRR